VTLGRLDIYCAVVTMSKFRVAPRMGHLEDLKRIYAYLRNFKRTIIKFKIEIPGHEHSVAPIMEYDWESVYGQCHEELPINMPQPKGKFVRTTTFVDANLMHDVVTGRSCTGVLHFLNQTPVEWYCKRQNTVETATYGSEFVAARVATDQIVDLRYTLRMLGVPIDGSSWLFGDNFSVVVSSTVPQSSLKKRHNALSYHRVREAIADKILTFRHIPSVENPADILTKILTKATWWHLMKQILYHSAT
ncbi:MAG: Ty1/Copia family ribonuclease HI, partial [Gloeomargaritales cyanobacterium]